MKTRILSFVLLLGFASAALAIDPSELDNRIRGLTEKLDVFQHQRDKRIPPDTFRRAQGILLLDRTKAGFLFAYQGGSGVAMVKDSKRDKWGPAAFVKADEASLGFQIGGEQHFVVVLFMTTNATRLLTDQKFDFAGEARGTAGNNSSGVQTTQPPGPSILVYDDRQGLYAGASLKGGAVTPDGDANRAYYGDYLSMQDILFNHRAQPTPAAINLANKIQEYSQAVPAGSQTSQR